MALEKTGLEDLPAPARHALVIILILAVAGIWYWMYQKPRNEQIDSIRANNDRLRIQLQQAESVKAEYDQYLRDLEEIEARLASLMPILPTEKEAAAFLRSVQDMAASSNLTINLFRPRTLVSREFYFDWPVEVRLEGNYHGLGRFFEQMSQATRIIDVPTITIENIQSQTDPNLTVVANGTVTTYVQSYLYIEEDGYDF